MKFLKLIALGAIICGVVCLIGMLCKLTATDDTPTVEDIEQTNIDNTYKPTEDSPSTDNAIIAEISGSTLTDIEKLNEIAKEYMKHIVAADLSFQDVKNIQDWVNQNRSNKAYINDFATIESAIGKYAKCVTFFETLPNIEVTDEVAQDFINMSQHIGGGATLKKLRIKLQKICLNKPTERNKEYLFELAIDPITSFADL